ncbi:MAG: hypothetical protein IPF47_24960 [Gemmatimonadetes bacterium]|nr:hypothetical protein [Gemmatimonadota bacterium]
MRRDLEVDGAVVASCTRPTRTHLTACGIALVALAVSALLLAAVAERAEARARGGLTFVLEGQRARGLAMQRAALADRNVLMLYGASELARPVPLRAQEFFASAPTGFRAFSVGERGTPLLMNLQSIVALLARRFVAAAWPFSSRSMPSFMRRAAVPSTVRRSPRSAARSRCYTRPPRSSVPRSRPS